MGWHNYARLDGRLTFTAVLKRIGIVAAGYSGLSIVCYALPSWVALIVPTASTAPFVLAVLGPPAMLLWGAEALTAFGWASAILVIPVLFTVATSWTDPWSGLCLFWGCIALTVWLACGWSSWLVSM
jgi:hypothetical protein